MAKFRTAVFTSIRSEYGPMRPLLDELQNDPAFDLQLLVGGGHLSERYGYTKKDIVADKRPIAAEFDFLAEPPEGDYLTKSLGKLQEQIGAWLQREKPDWMVILGDRFELLPVASAALLYRIPLVHISGGDITEGAIDNQVRHAISKIASVHFPATETAKQVLLAMGEEEWRICVSGEPALDQVLGMEYMSKEELFTNLGLKLDMPTAILTFHPDTISNAINPDFVTRTVSEIVKNGMQVIATGSNFDEGGDAINEALKKLAAENPLVHFEMSLGQRRYYSMLHYATLMVGNSSSGIWEAQSFGLPVINVGSRQLGRLSNPNVVHIPVDISAIIAAIPQAIGSDFRKEYFGKPNLYGDGKACKQITQFLKTIPREKLLSKR